VRTALLTVGAVLVGTLSVVPAEAHVTADTHAQRDHVVGRARARLGANYCWGGTRRCFDCSGFTYRVYRHHGASLPHSSSMQWRARRRDGWATTWRIRGLRRGDLVFFKNTYKRGISHVGVYTGNRRFIHASSNGVKRSVLRDYYRQHFAAGVRPRRLRF
jgi:peptidoglycan DL-endopeptidase LytE